MPSFKLLFICNTLRFTTKLLLRNTSIKEITSEYHHITTIKRYQDRPLF